MSAFRSSESIRTCTLCERKVTLTSSWVRKAGRAWRIPVYVCTDVDCMTTRGVESIEDVRGPGPGFRNTHMR